MLLEQNSLSTRCISSLSKVFADSDFQDNPINKGSALINETYSFQVAYHSKRLLKQVRVDVHSDLEECISVRSVGLVPSELPCYHDHDQHILKSVPGLYPDPLYPIHESDGLIAFPNQWRSLWVSVDLHEKVKPGLYPIEVSFQLDNGELLGKETFELEVLPALLPEQNLIHTEWFHTDCLATYYNVEVFSKEHWDRIGQFLQTAAQHGINMVLTPLFTPPLDTEVGGERPTVQLVDVQKHGQSYRFTFDKLKRWVELCWQNGIYRFEFSHLFTQWGAKHAPKIMAIENNQLKQIFGWETDASGAEYHDFLSQFLPKLIDFIKDNKLEDNCYFHISDEPHLDHLDSYQSASAIIRKYLKEFPIIDALSDFAFYEKGLVETPIPSNDHIDAFLKNGVENLWTYYCCAQYKGVSNRFFNMPSWRNRVLGYQLYKFQIKGFLHWGYNFWYSQFSKMPIDPFKNTDASYSFASGDAFLVYPGGHGPIESIRMEVLTEALQDLRALQLLESLIGRERVLEMLEEGLTEEITFSQYPAELEWYLAKREQINRKIMEHCK